MSTIAVVVDDEPITRMDIAGILSENGYVVAGQGHDGFDAIELCRAHNPDFVLLDIKMPTFDGLSAASTILADGTCDCIILLTAFSDRQFIEKAKQLGVSGYLVKPVEERTLLSTVEIALAQSERYRQARQNGEAILRKLEKWKVIDRAKAIVANRDGITESDAFARMRRMAMDKRVGMVEIAAAIVSTAQDRTAVDRAKRFLMHSRRIGEDSAFRLIRDRAAREGIDLALAAEEFLREGGA